ncbi:hypothetical protein [Ferrimonas pelagia]|uniref:hypothetical protein n=1 Tax=Ferrimonas pelagia TaxID=1177826 RepID=UPI0031E59DA2
MPAYQADGTPSFAKCRCCDFAFGSDDDPALSREAVVGIQLNWERWRQRWLLAKEKTPEQLESLCCQLARIGIQLDDRRDNKYRLIRRAHSMQRWRYRHSVWLIPVIALILAVILGIVGITE